jgi:prephenate dehydratase
VHAAIQELSRHTSTCEVLGSFPKAEQPLNE